MRRALRDYGAGCEWPRSGPAARACTSSGAAKNRSLTVSTQYHGASSAIGLTCRESPSPLRLETLDAGLPRHPGGAGVVDLACFVPYC